MAKVIRKARIGLADLMMTQGSFSRGTSNSGTQTMSPMPCIVVDPNGQYTTLAAAVAACPAGGVVFAPYGSYAPTATLSITQAMSIIGGGADICSIAPTAAVTTAGITVNTSGKVTLRGFTLDMSAITSIKGLNIAQAGNYSRFEDIKVNKGTYGLDIASTGLSLFRDIRVENCSTAYIRLQDDSGGENVFDNVWMVNNAGQTVTDGFLLSRTTSTDVGGLYMRGVRYVQNSALGGATTNGFRFVSTAGAATPIFLVASDCVCDGVTGNDTVKFDNVKKVLLQNCTFTNGAAAGSNFTAIQLLNSSEIYATGNNNWSSSGHCIRLKGTVDIVEVIGAVLGGGSGKNAVFLDTSPTLSNIKIPGALNYVDSTVTFTNDVAALRAGSNGLYSDATGGLELRGASAFMRVPNATAYQTLTAAGAAAALLILNASDNVLHQGVSGAAQIFYADQASTEIFRIASAGLTLAKPLYSKPTVSFASTDATPSVAGGNVFKTANAAPTTITMLDDGVNGQEVNIIIGDANTTIDFTGTNLKGNAGGDWTPTTNDSMICVFDGTNWYCRISDNTA